MIDVLVLDMQGVFVIEAKNLNGQIEGRWDKKELDIYYPNNDRHKLYNPVIQNKNHILYLKKVLDIEDRYFRNIVVFGNQTRFSFENVPWDANLCNIRTLNKAMERLLKRFPCEIENHKLDVWQQNLERISGNMKEVYNL